MKKLVLILGITFLSAAIMSGCSKENDTPKEDNPEEAKAEIIRLEKLHIQAILGKDTVTLKQIMDDGLLVNNPRNTVTVGSAGVITRVANGELAHSSYLFEMEQILLRGNTAVTMGSETVVPSVGPENGQTIKRRYSQIWQKQPTGWKMLGRHANKIP